MAKAEAITINYEDLTAQDWIDARRIMQLGGVDPGAVDLANIAACPSPVPVLAALLFVSLRKEAPRITPGRCVRLAVTAIAQGD